jgi:hypothetical protein
MDRGLKPQAAPVTVPFTSSSITSGTIKDSRV